MAREWRYDTDRWLWGCCWLPLAVMDLVLADFGSGELLDVSIPIPVPNVFLLSMAFIFLCNDDMKYEHTHNRHTGGGHVK